MTKIYIDAGHGGNDPGAVGNGLQEKNVNLDIALRIRDLLKDYEDVQVRLSRVNDKTVRLKQRTDDANKWGADLLISIHVNAGGGTGFESFIYNGPIRANTSKYRDVIHAEIMKVLKGVRDRGRKRQNFHMLRESKMPALLTENMFIDNKADSDLLKKQSFINQIAQGHVNGIVKLFNLKKKKTTSNNGKLYKVQVGAFSKKTNADRLAAELKKKGYDTYIVHE